MADLLDTNMISEPRKPRPEPKVLTYFRVRPLDKLFISTVVLVEIRYGISTESSFEKRDSLNNWLEKTIEPFFAGRTLPVSEPVLLRWLTLMEFGRKRGRTYSQPDLLLAATALEHNLTLVTRNTRDFTSVPDLKLLNPWDS